jgi:hypothetical protein
LFVFSNRNLSPKQSAIRQQREKAVLSRKAVFESRLRAGKLPRAVLMGVEPFLV